VVLLESTNANDFAALCGQSIIIYLIFAVSVVWCCLERPAKCLLLFSS